MKSLPIYLDNNSTTPLHPDVISLISKALKEVFGNPSSSHYYGWNAKETVEIAREQVANLLGTSAECIIFTSGATESNNIVIQGFVNSLRFYSKNVSTKIISTPIEHSSILQTIYTLSERNLLTYNLLPVNSYGELDFKSDSGLFDSLSELTSDTLVTVQYANNEIGTIQNLDKFKDLGNAFIHSDITQAIGKIPFTFERYPIDAVSLSGHKFHAPKGIGVLAFKNKESMNKISAIVFGGNHEKSLRAGTISVPLIAGLGKASEIANNSINDNKKYLRKLSKIFFELISKKFSDIKLLGPSLKSQNRLPGNLSLLIPGINGAELCSKLSTTVAISTSSACLSSSGKTSHVLSAIGLDKSLSKSVIRIGISTLNTEKEIISATSQIMEKIKLLRREKNE